MKKKNIIKFVITWITSFFVLFSSYYAYLFYTTPNVQHLKRFHPTRKELQQIRKTHFHETVQAPFRYQWIPLSRIPKRFQRTVIVAEDASFYVHHGVDWYEIKESFLKNWKSGKFLRGGSTITQQLAKNLFLSGEKSLKRKFREWFIAYRMEKELRKSRILELYLNIVEWGRGVFGIGAAAEYYFGKTPGDLTLDEMVRLAAVLPNPKKMRPDRVTYSVYWRSKVILHRLLFYHDITREEYQQALEHINHLYHHSR